MRNLRNPVNFALFNKISRSKFTGFRRMLTAATTATAIGTAIALMTAMIVVGAWAEDAPPTMAVETSKDPVQEPASQPASDADESPLAPPSSPEPNPSERETLVGDHPSPGGSMPQEVVIKGEGGSKLKATKPPLDLVVDPFDSIRESLKPDQQMLLAESPLTVVWRRTHPEFLRNPRVIQPWRTLFSERPGFVFRPRDQLFEVLGRKIEPREAKRFQWELSIADEEGKVFQQYEGSGAPPEEILWSGQNEQDEWLRAGKAYSPVYKFTDSSGTPYTRAGRPLKERGVVHQERNGLFISVDSTALFGGAKESGSLQGEGEGILRAAADYIKRRHPGVPLRVEAYSSTRELAERQAQTVTDFLVRELMLMPQDISSEARKEPYSEQRLDIVLVNR